MQTNRDKIIEQLVEHYSLSTYHPEEKYENVVNFNGKYLGPYIPYVGTQYLNFKPRLMIYAMAQNLNRAENLGICWLHQKDHGLKRQYYQQTRIQVHPWDIGHLKVIAALALTSYPGTQYRNIDNISEVVAVTNFVKFSFYKQGKNGKRYDCNPPKSIYDEMWKLYCKYEIELLEPDIIIGVGNDVADAIKKNMLQAKMSAYFPIKIPFPGRLNLNANWIPEGNKLIQKSNYDATSDKKYFSELLRGTPDINHKIGNAINTDWYYFRYMRSLFTSAWY